MAALPLSSRRTRIKICGLTQPEDAHAAAAAGADAVGLVFYPPSPRHLSFERARGIALAVPPFITRVAVIVDPEPEAVRALLAAVPIEILQFHGNEPEDLCAAFGRPFLKAARLGGVAGGVDLLEYSVAYPRAAGFLVDTYRADKPGGTGEAFDWNLIPAAFDRPLVLSGGLEAANVGAAIRRVRPWAVDVSSGVESRPGVKDAQKIAAFAAGVHDADQ